MREVESSSSPSPTWMPFLPSVSPTPNREAPARNALKVSLPALSSPVLSGRECPETPLQNYFAKSPHREKEEEEEDERVLR